MDSGGGNSMLRSVPSGTRQAAWLVAPAALSVVGHLVFAALLLTKWQGFEEVEGGPLVAANLSSLDTGAMGIGPSWLLVFAPAWAADAAVVCSSVFALCFAVGGASVNARIGHANALSQAALAALFKLNLLQRLQDAHGAWLPVFWPLYGGLAVQMLLHTCKQVRSPSHSLP